jgi:hypothetical protein
MIINFNYTEIVYEYCTEKFIVMLVEMVGFEPGTL